MDDGRPFVHKLRIWFLFFIYCRLSELEPKRERGSFRSSTISWAIGPRLKELKGWVIVCNSTYSTSRQWQAEKRRAGHGLEFILKTLFFIFFLVCRVSIWRQCLVFFYILTANSSYVYRTDHLSVCLLSLPPCLVKIIVTIGTFKLE